MRKVAVIVAHPDDETLWSGGTLLNHPHWKCFVVCLCRKNDAERATRYSNALAILNAEGAMGDLDDGPDQQPLDEDRMENAILHLLPPIDYDLIITHNVSGEYTRHLRHEEVHKAVVSLWNKGKIRSKHVWCYAYEDGNKTYLPKAVEQATFYLPLSKPIWEKKYALITQTYGFLKDSWEARATPVAEAFWEIKRLFFSQKPVNTTENNITFNKLNTVKLLTK